MAPEQLWILNPRKLLRRQIDPVASTSSEKVSTLTMFNLCCYNDIRITAGFFYIFPIS